MGEIRKNIIICDEMIANLKHCLERTDHMWEWGIDMWPLDITHIIKEWEKSERINEI